MEEVATLKQAGKVLELLAQKEVSRQQLQKLVGSGLLADLLDADVDSIDRDAFRKVIGLKPLGEEFLKCQKRDTFIIPINYDLPLKDSIKAGKYGWENDDITTNNFPSQETGTREVTVSLLHFGQDITTDQVLSELDNQGYRPATLKELLALGEKFPDLQRNFPIIALGSVWLDLNGHRRCPCLSRGGSERSLGLSWVDGRWDGICRFAAVRKGV